jgi:hypothetical protein
MTGLEDWLQKASRHLSKESAVRVRTEIQAHYEAAREAAIAAGASPNQADLGALAALGDAKTSTASTVGSC